MRRAMLTCGLLLLVPLAAHAAGAEAEDETARVFWEVLNLALLGVVLFYAFRKPVGRYLSERSETVRANIAASDQLLKEAESRLAEWNVRAARVEADIREIREHALRAAEREAEDIIAQANATAARVRDSAHVAVDRELRSAREKLREEAVSLAIDAAQRVLREQVNDADRSRLVDEFIRELEQGGAH